MKTPALFKEYIWLVNTIHSAKRISFADFELNLRPTTDFKGQLLSRGVWLKVLEPQWLANEIRQWHEDFARMYQEK